MENEITVFEQLPGEWAVFGAGQYEPYDPAVPGHVPMTKERAEEVAEDLRRRLLPAE